MPNNYAVTIEKDDKQTAISVLNWGTREINDKNGADNNGKGPFVRYKRHCAPTLAEALRMMSEMITWEEIRGESPHGTPVDASEGWAAGVDLKPCEQDGARSTTAKLCEPAPEDVQ